MSLICGVRDEGRKGGEGGDVSLRCDVRKEEEERKGSESETWLSGRREGKEDGVTK